jgi:hypothetical protein
MNELNRRTFLAGTAAATIIAPTFDAVAKSLQPVLPDAD